MPQKKKKATTKETYRGYFINPNTGEKIEVDEHTHDFTVLTPEFALKESQSKLKFQVEGISEGVTRVKARTAAARDTAMQEIREQAIAHHIYRFKGSDQEVLINDKVRLRLKKEDDAALKAILDEFNLIVSSRMGRTHVLEVTDETGMNPLRVANVINERDEVEYCSPNILHERTRFDVNSFDSTHVLFPEQWYLSAELTSHMDVLPDAGANVPEAWQSTLGDSSIVLAVMDDIPDLGHKAFHDKQIHPEGKNFTLNPPDSNLTPGGGDNHHTPVASIATSSTEGNGMVGVAPNCTYLPIGIAFGPLDEQQSLKEFRHASQFADVVNCSFGFPPLPFDLFDPGFKEEISLMTQTGGRRGNGLVIVFAAGNDDAPTSLSAAENKNGIKFLGRSNQGFFVREIDANQAVFSGYPSIPGVIVVAACSSQKRKSGYSNFGSEITVAAPSSNGNQLAGLLPGVFGPRSRYRGLGQIAASNRPGFGSPSQPMPDRLSTPNFREDHYTAEFGGTSGAAPVVSGIAGLMLSVNPNLTAAQVKNILEATADKDLDTTPDLDNDPNLQGLSGEFDNGRSLFFGAGKVNAAAAVERAKSLMGPISAETPSLTSGLGAPFPANLEALNRAVDPSLAAEVLRHFQEQNRLLERLLVDGQRPKVPAELTAMDVATTAIPISRRLTRFETVDLTIQFLHQDPITNGRAAPITPLTSLVGSPPAITPFSTTMEVFAFVRLSNFFNCVPRVIYNQSTGFQSVGGMADAVFNNREAQSA